MKPTSRTSPTKRRATQPKKNTSSSPQKTGIQTVATGAGRNTQGLLPPERNEMVSNSGPQDIDDVEM